MNSRLVRAFTLSSRTLYHPFISKTISRPFTQTAIVKMANRVHRITMFKLPSKDDQAKLLDQYHKLDASQQRVTSSDPNLIS